MPPSLTPALVLEAYRHGLFPMADHANDHQIQWVYPEIRGILPVEKFHVPKKLLKTIRQGEYEIRINTAFEDVIKACAAPAPKRPETWINDEIIRIYTELHHQGYAHSVEYWTKGKLSGGLYGLAMGSAFFGESMFSHTTDASKIALVHLAARLYTRGFTLLDAQFTNEHLKQFGLLEHTHETYMTLLMNALSIEAEFKSEITEEKLLNRFLERKNYES